MHRNGKTLDARAFVGGLSIGELRRFLPVAGVDWRTSPIEPTCDHVACHQEYLFVADEWAFPALAVPQAGAGDRRVAARRWPRLRLLLWEGTGEGDGR